MVLVHTIFDKCVGYLGVCVCECVGKAVQRRSLHFYLMRAYDIRYTIYDLYIYIYYTQFTIL